MNKQFLKFLFTLPFLFLLLTPQISNAQITGYMSDEKVMSIDCSVSLCLSPISIKNAYYQGAKYTCDGYINGDCNMRPEKLIVALTPLQAAIATIQSMVSASANNQNTKVTGYSSCTTYGEGIEIYVVCNTTGASWGVIPGTETYGWIPNGGGNTGSSILRRPMNCPSGGVYIYGKGCALSNWNDNGVLKKTIQSPALGYCSSTSLPLPEAQAAQELSQCKAGNPVDVNTGSKVDTRMDLNSQIPFMRTYSSIRSEISALGLGWRHVFDKKLVITNGDVNGDQIPFGLMFDLENGAQVFFNRATPTSDFIVAFNEHKGYSVTLSGTGYILNSPNGSKEHYDSSGFLTKMVNRSGYEYNFSYTEGKLISVVDSYGRSLTFSYNPQGFISQISSNNGDYVDYNYNGNLLIQANFKNVETIGYGYTNDLLTSKTDANGNVYALYTYDEQKRVIESKHVNAPNSFNSLNQYVYTASNITQTLPDGSTSVYGITFNNFRNRSSSVNLSSGKNTYTLQYDANGNVNSLYNGIFSGTYNYNTNNNLLSNSNYKGVARTYTWNEATRQISSYTQNDGGIIKTYAFTYDTDGNITQEQVTSAGVTRTWNYTYTTYGRLLTSTTPTGATTTYTYYSDSHPTIRLRGMVNTITNAQGHTITVNDYNEQGLPINISMLNGLSKTMTYDSRGRVLTETTVNGTNTYVYDANGSLTQASFSNGYVLNMTYDGDSRMTSMTDNRGNSLVYILDTNGNPINESEYSNNVLVSVKNSVFDGLSRMTQSSRNLNALPYSYTYDLLNRTTKIKNPNNDEQTISYDQRDEVTAINGLARTQNMTRDGMGNITSFNQQSNTTNFTYNGFGEVLTMMNPDTGSHSFTYNLSTRTTTHVDNINTNHVNVYDYLGRLVTNTSAGNTQTFTWDTLKLGKLSSISDSSGSTEYSYDSNARLNAKTQNIGSISKSVGYEYDTSGQLNKIIYPSSVEINYEYNNGVISAIRFGNENILSSIGYKGFNSNPLSWNWSDNSSRVMTLDLNQRLVSLVDGQIINQTIAQDNVDNITSVSDSVNPNNSFTANYSLSEQLTTFNHSSGNKTFIQDSKFNLTRVTPFDATYDRLLFSLNTSNNKIYSIRLGSTSTTYPTYDFKGNMVNDGSGGVFSYDSRNNMISANKINNATYTYNALSQRVSKTVNVGGVSTTTYFVYNEDGLLIGEYDNSGNAIAEHVYLKSIPVAVIKSGVVYKVHTDYLGTPRYITNNSGAIVWKWENKNAYGLNPAEENISGTPFEYNIRFAGQYFDKESGLHYNYHRMYNPMTGRYMQPDPLGVNGGMNIYSYVENNPLNAVDPYGLFAQYLMAPAIGAGVGGILGYYDSGFDGLKRGALQGGITGLGIVGAGKLIGIVAKDSVLTQVGANVMGAAIGEVAGQVYSNNSCNIDFGLVGVAATTGLIASPIFKPYILRNQTVTSWAKTGVNPDLNSGRWVMMGNDNYLNYGLSGALHNNKNNYITGTIKGENLQYPNGLESFKGIIGQRVIK